MTGIQLLLITGVIFIFLYFIQRLQKAVMTVLLLVLFGSLAIIFILKPELTNALAHKIGVGRGADLIFYCSIMFFWYIILRLYTRIRKLENMMTELIRKQSMNNAVSPVVEE